MVKKSQIREEILRWLNLQNGISDVELDFLFLLHDSRKHNSTWEQEIEDLYKLPYKLLNVYRAKRSNLILYICHKFNISINENVKTIGEILNNLSNQLEIKDEILRYFDIDGINEFPFMILLLQNNSSKQKISYEENVYRMYEKFKEPISSCLIIDQLNLIIYIEHFFNVTINDDEMEYIITLDDLIKKVQEKLTNNQLTKHL